MNEDKAQQADRPDKLKDRLETEIIEVGHPVGESSSKTNSDTPARASTGSAPKPNASTNLGGGGGLPAGPESEDEWQENFVEQKDPTELIMCFVLAAAYIGLAKFCWVPLLLNRNWKMLFNVEGFFITIAAIAILVGLRPYISPSNLQLSRHGIKYRGPYSPSRQTVNWEKVLKVWVSPEIVFVLYQPDPLKKLKWVMIIACVYLSDRERIGKLFIKHCPIPVFIMTTPTLFSRILLGLFMFCGVIWFLEMMIN